MYVSAQAKVGKDRRKTNKNDWAADEVIDDRERVSVATIAKVGSCDVPNQNQNQSKRVLRPVNGSDSLFFFFL